MSKWTLIVWLAASCAAASADIVAIDFGSPESPVREGFVRVTPQTGWALGQKVGWVDSGDAKARDVPVSREWHENRSRGTKEPPPIYTTDLSRDHLEGTTAATLRIATGAGKFHAWLLCGHAGGSGSQVWDVQATAGRTTLRATFPGPHAQRLLEADLTSTADHVDLQLTSRSRWLVNALVLAPASEVAAARKQHIDRVEQEVFLLPEDELKKWKRTPHLDETPLPKFPPADEKRGFAIYHRPWAEPVWPNTHPRPEDLSAPVRAFATRGEYEPMTFTLYPLRDLDNVTVEVSDLRTSEGAAIAASQIDVRCVRYMFVRPNYRVYGVYYRAPDVLMPMSPQRLRRGESLRAWLTVHVDEFAPEGIYDGQALVLVGGRAVASVPLKLRVLPFALERDRDMVIGQYYHHPYAPARSAPDAFSRNWWRRKAELEHADMAAHGANTVTMGVWAPAPRDGRWRFNFDYLAPCIDLYRRYGFYHPIPLSIPTSSLYGKYLKGGMGSHLRLVQMPPRSFFPELTEMVRQIEAERIRRNWPEFLYYPVDEPSTRPDAVAFMAEVLKAIKQVPGVRTYVTADPTHEQFDPMRPYVDVWCCQPFNPEREAILADMKAHTGREYWCYPNHVAGENDHTPVAGARMTYGFGLWRSGFRALIPWIYQAVIADPWNYLDGTAMDFFNRTGDEGEPIPVGLWEAYREGLDDYGYLTTLNAWIDRASAAGRTDAAAAAERERQFVWDSITVQTKYKYDDLWDPAAFDVYRWLLANEILKLQAALSG